MSIFIREAGLNDVRLIIGFIRDLAEYERLATSVEATEETIRSSLFAPAPKVFCTIAEWVGEPAGFALWFYTFSTFLGRHGIWLEDFFVRPDLRGRGIGTALLRDLAQRCQHEDLGRLEWSVLDWNEPSIRFYRSLGAEPSGGWQSFRLAGAELARLAAEPR